MAVHILEEAQRCLNCKVPMCQKGCPIHTPIPKVIRLMLDGKLDEAGWMLFENNPRVRVIDSKTAVGGMKILVRGANKYLDESLDFVENKLNELIPKIRVLAVPDTLDYLHKGGRLSKAGWVVGSVLKIKPIIELKHTVKAAGKTLGLRHAMKYILTELEKCDARYPIVPSYTYATGNLDELIGKTKEEYQKAMIEKDNIDPAVAAHWGPNAFGYIYVEK